MNTINNYLQAKIAEEQVRVEEGIFEPLWQGSFSKQKTNIPNTTDEILTRRQSEYQENTNALTLGMNGLIASGAQWNMQWLNKRTSSSTIDTYRDYGFENTNELKLSLEQPILKGYGKEITKAKIDSAKIQGEVDSNKFEQKIMELAGVTIQLYWKLSGLQRIHQTWEKSLEIAEAALKDTELRALNGKIPQTELMEARSAIIAQRGELYNARSKMVEVQNQLLTLINVSKSDNRETHLVAADNPFGNYRSLLTPEEYLKAVLERWPEYKIAKSNAEKEKVQVRYAKNQLLPQLNMVGSVSSNTLDSEAERAMRQVPDGDFISWSMGLKFSMPMYENTQARSGLNIAELRARQADNELASVVTSLNNSFYSKLEELHGLQEQIKEYENGLAFKTELFEIEKTKLASGRISLKNLLDKEEDYVNYQRKVLSTVVNYKVAEAALDIAVGDILARYHIDKTKFSCLEAVEPARLETIFQ